MGRLLPILFIEILLGPEVGLIVYSTGTCLGSMGSLTATIGS